MGIWATCARRMEGRATEELKVLFEEVSRTLSCAVRTNTENSVLSDSMAWYLDQTKSRR
jgi:hypothetical protein